MGEARSVTSIIGNAVAAVVIAKWEKAFDAQKMHEALFHQSDVEEALADADAQRSHPASATEGHRTVGS